MRAMFKTDVLTSLVGIVGLLLVGCGAARHTAKFETVFTPKPDTRIEVGPVTNETGKTFTLDLPKMMTDALSKTLEDERLLWTGNRANDRVIMTSQIVEYEVGDAIKLWLLPG